jgi:hypothetical protein
MGFLVESLRDRGVEAYGLDISDYALGQVRADIRPYTWQGSVAEPLPRRYDLIVCIEVLEHLPAAHAVEAVLNFCRHADNVLFSSTPVDFREISHINVRPVEYWAELFAEQGFFRDLDFDATVILPWSALFRKAPGPAARAVGAYERRLWLLSTENRELRGELHDQNVQMRAQIAERDGRLAERDKRITDLEGEVAGRGQVLDQITSSLGWQILQKLAPLRRYGIPPGSRRERAVQKLLGLGRPATPRAV